VFFFFVTYHQVMVHFVFLGVDMDQTSIIIRENNIFSDLSFAKVSFQMFESQNECNIPAFSKDVI